jgi:hemerythrin-like domain-containing protein
VSTTPHPEPLAVTEMKLIHDVHRAATSLLAESAARPGASPAELGELRDFVVAALHHHHQTEDDLLWPVLEAADPEVADGLSELSAEHESLDTALAALNAAEISAGEPGTPLSAASETVRELVHQHLAHEEPETFPALRMLSDEQWADFSRGAVATAPAAGIHLQIGFMDEVGEPGYVAAVLAGLPAPAVLALPAMRGQARATLAALRAGAGVAS